MNRIRELRIEANMQQKDLAKLMNVAPNSICRYERGDTGIDDETICRLCEIFHCTSDYLLCRSDVREPFITEKQAGLLDAYRKASERDRELIDRILSEYGEKEKSAVS